MKKLLTVLLTVAMLFTALTAFAEEADTTLNLAEIGMFSAGGTVTEPVEGEYDPTQNWMDVNRPGNTAHVDHANVLYMTPVEDNGNPIVYLHGYGQSRMGWLTTPDGRDGWAQMFLRNGHAAYLVDQPGRGEAGAATSMTTDGFLDAWAEDSKDYKPGDQDQFFRQMTPNTTTFDMAKSAAAVSAVLAEVKERTGNKSVFITHSQGGAVGWDVDVENISAIIAIEPGGAPQVDSEQYNKLLEARIPIIFYYGDYMENGPEDIMSSGFWSGIKAGSFAFAEAYNAAGGDATVIDLPAIGITGNSHFMFQELNNREIADHIENWLGEHGLN